MTDHERESLHKEIDLIQSCITRMANNSFLVKGWTITLVTAVLAFGDKFTDLIYLCFILVFPIISFWYLDAFFLQTERKYRNLYNWVIKERPENNLFLFDLNPHRSELKKVDSICLTMFSKTLWPLYLVPLLTLFITIIINLYQKKC